MGGGESGLGNGTGTGAHAGCSRSLISAVERVFLVSRLVWPGSMCSLVLVVRGGARPAWPWRGRVQAWSGTCRLALRLLWPRSVSEAEFVHGKL